jgi:hypothetical protein
MMDTVYYIVATNKLSGKREAVSAAYYDREKVEGIRKNYLRVLPSKRTHLRPKIHQALAGIDLSNKIKQ